MSFWYLCTPYSRYPDGMENAYIEACRNAALLIRARVPVFAPIAHSHPIAEHGGLPAVDHDLWLPADVPFIRSAFGAIVCMMEGWEESTGVTYEIAEFHRARKPVVYMTPGTVPQEVDLDQIKV